MVILELPTDRWIIYDYEWLFCFSGKFPENLSWKSPNSSRLCQFFWYFYGFSQILPGSWYIPFFLSFFLSFSLSFFFFPELKGIFVDPEGFFSFFLLFQWKDSLGYSGLLRNLWCSFWDSLGFLRILSPSIRASEILCDIPEDSLPTLTDSGPFSRPFSRTHSHSIGILFGIGWNNLGFFA